MNEPHADPLTFPGLDLAAVSAAPAASQPPGRARVRPVDRSQLLWRSVDVERLVEEDHPVRAIWALTGELDLRSFYAPIEAVEGTAGRTAWDPRLLMSLWIYGYSRGVSSAREIERRCGYEPGFAWLCGMEPINHHTLSDFRVAHEAALGKLFVEVLGVLTNAGLVSLERVMHDGTKVKACASRDSFRREDKLQAHLAAARQHVEALRQSEKEQPTRQEAAVQRAARERQERVAQALQQLDDLRQAKRGPQAKEHARASVSDPSARVMKQPDGGFAPSYNVQVSTEARNKIIVGVAVSQEGTDYGALPAAIQRIRENCGNSPTQMVVDGGFTCRENIGNANAQGIDLYGAWGEQEQKALGSLRQQGVMPEFYPSAFHYDAVQDRYQCPAGQTLSAVGRLQKVGVVQYQYRAEALVCQACSSKGQCCPKSKQGRSINRSVDEPDVRQFREKMQTPQAQEIYRQRGAVAEFPHAWIKDKLGLRQFRLRGLSKVGMEALWACLTYNVSQWIRLAWRPALAAQR